jgi:YidC/Oxa1 family membrane protein insertase
VTSLQRRMAGAVRGRRLPSWLGPALLVVTIALVAAACAGSPAGSGGSAGASSAPVTPQPALTPAPLHADPIGLLSWAYTPIFQVMLILLVGIYDVIPNHDIGVAIAVMTLIVRTALVPLMRRQMVTMRRTQMLAPEIKEIQRRFKGDRIKQQQATSELYKERGISQFGCLASILPLILILPMYTVIRDGLQNFNPVPDLTVFGVQVVPLVCTGTGLPDVNHYIKPCLDTIVPWLGNLDVSQPSVIPLPLPVIGSFGLSLLAVVYTLIQLVASRMALPPHDPGVPLDANARTQRQTMLFVPLISIFYGGIIPVGLYIYLVVSTIYQIGQQFLTTGWGGMFPLFGWTPAFAVDHTPRFPVAFAAPKPATREAGAPARLVPPRPSSMTRAASAAATVRPSQKGRQGRRGRRR